MVRNAHNLFVLPFVVFCFDVSFILYEFFLNIIQKFPLPPPALLSSSCVYVRKLLQVAQWNVINIIRYSVIN